MSIALDAITLNDSLLNKSQMVTIPIQPLRVAALRIYNDSPYYLLLNNVPGINQMWMPPGLEDLYITGANMSGNEPVNTRGYFNFTEKDFSLVPQITSNVYNLFVTIYEVGDILPVGLPLEHQSIVNVANSVLPVISILADSQTVGAGLAGSVSISAPDDSFGNLYYTCLAGMAMRVGIAAAAVSGTATVFNVVQVNLHDKMDAITSGPSVLERNFTAPIRSLLPGQASNGIQFSFPATAGFPAYSMDIWGFALKAANIA